MKKFFSLLCATLLVFSASAAPVAKKAEIAKKAVAVEQMQKVQFEKAQTATLQSDGIQLEPMQTSNENQLSAAPALKVNNQKATAPAVKANSQKVAKANKQMVRRSAANAKKVAKAPLNTAITIGTFSPATYEGEYYVTLTDANSTTQFFFDFDTSVNPFEVGKTYTLDEMIADYVALGDKNDWYVWETATAATYTETVDEKGLTHIVASMTTESGTYDITYDQPEPQDINVTAVDWGYDGSEYDVYVYSETTTYLFELKEDLVYGKAYTYADMVPTWTCTLDYGYPDITATDATLTVSKDEAGLIHIAATMVLSGNKHIIAYDEKAFVPTGVKIDVNGTDLNGRYMSSYGFYLYTATWGDYIVQLAFDAEEEKAAYTNDDFIADYGLIYTNSEKIPLLKLASDNITITNTETTKTLAGSVYAKNGDEYVLNLVWEKPKVESISVLVEDATMTKKTLFFMVDGDDTENAYGITVRVNSKVLEGEFTLDNCEPNNTGVTDLSAKKWFDTDSCYIKTQMLGSNTLLMQGILYTHNTALDRYINAEFVLTARVDANGELMNIYGGIVEPAKGDTISLTRSEKGTAFFKSTYGLDFDNQSGKTTMVAVNDSAYYWYNPISKFTPGYWIKGIKDKEANTINFDTAQVINVYNGGLLGLMKWMKATTAGKITIATDGAKQFVLDINEDTLTLHGSAPFDFSQDIYFPGVVVPGYGFQNYGDAGTILTVNKPITERDTVDVILKSMDIDDQTAAYKAVMFMAGADITNFEEFMITTQNVSTVEGTFSFATKTILSTLTYAVDLEGNELYFQDGVITVASDDQKLSLIGWLIGEDEKYYRINWSQPANALNYDTNAPFDATFAYSDMDATIANGVIGIYATNADGYTIGLKLYADPAATEIPAGTYTISDSQEAGTALKSIGLDEEGYLTKCWASTLDEEGYIDDCWFMVEGTITLSYDEYGKLKVVVDAKNSYEQPVTALVKYEKLEPKSVVEIKDATFSILDGYLNYGYIDLAIYSSQKDTLINIDVNTDTIFGDFSKTVSLPYSYIATMQSEMGVIDAYSLVVSAEGKYMTLTASILGADTIQYNISATGYYGAIMYDSEEAYAGSIAMEDVTITKNNVKKQATITGITTTNDSINIIINTSERLVDGKLPAGVYEDIEASTGVNDEYEVTPSFVWSIKDETWFIQSGKLTVAEDGSMKLEGINSYDKSVVIDFTVPTGLRNAKANVKAAKQIKNGQIVIIRENKEYNILGAAL